MSEEQIAAARVFLRAYRRLTLWLATYTLGTLIGGTLMTFSGSDWTVEIGKVLAGSSLIAAVMLVLICWGLANAHCPMCHGAYYAPAKVTHRLLHATLPLRRKPAASVDGMRFGYEPTPPRPHTETFLQEIVCQPKSITLVSLHAHGTGDHSQATGDRDPL